MKVCGQKVVKFCGHTHTRGSISSKDYIWPTDRAVFITIGLPKKGDLLLCSNESIEPGLDIRLVDALAGGGGGQ